MNILNLFMKPRHSGAFCPLSLLYFANGLHMNHSVALSSGGSQHAGLYMVETEGTDLPELTKDT